MMLFCKSSKNRIRFCKSSVSDTNEEFKIPRNLASSSHYSEVQQRKFTMSLFVVCKKREMKQKRHAELKSSLRKISKS